MKRGYKKHLHRLKHPKTLLLLATIILAYIIFRGRNFGPFHEFLVDLGYLGYLIAGGFYAYGFTAAPATAVLLAIAKEHNIFFGALIGGIGALVGDLIIFFLIKYPLKKELKSLEKEKVVKFLEKEENKVFGKYKKYFLATFAGFLIATPLPTEIGIALMSSIKRMSLKKFVIIAYILHTLGIFIILSIGNII